ncbi:hypothetical protein [Lignipirellula cremea]|uniref:Uncharacterized protein n=1 Tax=Lignipirellula cremea TaxID=2528010 RepID=A0A518DZD6_9BACT|nr:hypothetical protein [Lignipirellula cremea]QDU97210.1 hypothetical protein Pla8534_50550 [Lignipirellula cremea]
MRFLALCALLACCGAATPGEAAGPHVTLELMIESGFPITGAQEWSRAMGRVGADNVRIREAKPGDQGEVVNQGDERTPRYHVTGFLRADGRLHLPGSRPIELTDIGQVTTYVSALRQNGLNASSGPPAAFGMSGEKLVEVHKALSRPVTISTKGKRPGDVMRELTSGLPLKVSVDPSTRDAFALQTTVAEELEGVSIGTAMAAILRPIGLVMLPFEAAGQGTQIGITDSRRAQETWPVGWPPQASPIKTMPKLYEFLEVEITDFALTDALGAIEKRLEAPMLFDHNSMAREGIDPASVKVSLPAGRTFYKKIVDRLLSQGKLKSELRVDEAGSPFLWITTIKQ